MAFIKFRIKRFIYLLIAVALLSGCKPKKRVIKSPPDYNFGEVQTIKLDLKLKEISGLAWDAARNEFLAHQDESGLLFMLDKETKAIIPPSPYKFGGKGDYEDVTIYNGTPYILRSDGMITKIIRDSAGVRGIEAGKLNITGTNDFETMYADTARKALIIVCKNCGMDDKTKVSAFAYYPDSVGFVSDPIFQIDAAKIKQMAAEAGHKKTSKFQPSAAAIHPILNKLFIISSASSQLVICDLNGNPESVSELGKNLFPQPEGLTFKNNDWMYISNEGVSSKGTILRFVYKP